MTVRELWCNIMFYDRFDHMPVVHNGIWVETNERWIKEGFPADAVATPKEFSFFNAVPPWKYIRINLSLYPQFKEEIIKDTDEYRIVKDESGVVLQTWKNQSSLPHYMDFTLKSAMEWPEYKRRLQPDPARIPSDLDALIIDAEQSGLPIAFSTASLMGWIRNWMGVINMSYLMYDDQDVYADMVNTLAELTCWGIDQVVPRMHVVPDLGFGWEDICGKNGPLINPDIFIKCVAPGYLKIRNKLEHYGVKLLGVDSDGCVDALVKPWLDSGVNLLYPIEIGTWNADPMIFRRHYGRELRMVGGFNKLELEKDKQAIDTEIERRIPLLRDGGYVIVTDHSVTPASPLVNYQYYLERIRALRF